jgi:hypothetical protein
MSRDDEWREKFRAILKEMIEIVWLASRDLSQVQPIALANLLRDPADSVESRLN